MTLIVEDGSGIYEANAYVGPGFVRNYLYRRNRANPWSNFDRQTQNASIIAATDYIDKRFGNRFLGEKQFLELDVSASNILTFNTNASEDDEVTIGDFTFVFKAVPSEPNEVAIGATSVDTLEAFAVAVGTVAQASVSATPLSGSSAVLVRAVVTGPLPAAIGTSSNTQNLSWDTTSLSGGLMRASQQLEFPRKFLVSREGRPITGIPEALKQAVVEYASRAISSDLMPDPTVDETGQSVSRTFDKVGPIETERRYVFGSAQDIFKKFPAADRLLTPFLSIGGSTYR